MIIDIADDAYFLWDDICVVIQGHTARRTRNKKLNWKSTKLTSAAIIHIYKCANDSVPNLHQHLGPIQLPTNTYTVLMSRCEYYAHCANITTYDMFFVSCFLFLLFHRCQQPQRRLLRRVICENILSNASRQELAVAIKIINIRQRTAACAPCIAIILLLLLCRTHAFVSEAVWLLLFSHCAVGSVTMTVIVPQIICIKYYVEGTFSLTHSLAHIPSYPNAGVNLLLLHLELMLPCTRAFGIIPAAAAQP